MTGRPGAVDDGVRDTWRRDGVVRLPGALTATDLDRIRIAWEWMLAHPGKGAQPFYRADAARFLQATGYSPHVPEFTVALRDTPVADIVRELFDGSEVRYLGEQLFLKDGDGLGARPGTRDSSYMAFEGPKLAVVWIALDPLPREAALEVVRGSHLGITYNGSMFDPSDDTLPLYPHSSLPRLPPIDAERDRWPIVGWPIEPGDLVVFHPACLHAAGGTEPGTRRRSLSLRFFGDDVVWVHRQVRGPDNAPVVRDGVRAGVDRFEGFVPGEPLYRSPGFVRVRPWDPDIGNPSAREPRA